MRVKGFIALKSKLSRSCNKFVPIFWFKLKKPFLVRSLLNHWCQVKIRKPPLKKRSLLNHWCQVKIRKPPLKKRTARFFSILCFLKKKKKRNMNKLNELRSFSDTVSDAKLLQSPRTPGLKLFPSPLTPTIVRKAEKSQILRDEGVEDACKSFENYLVHMIVEEGKVEDLMDIEDLLYCWRNLKSPVFVDLVSRFYGELCKDLFSNDKEDNNRDGQK